MSVLDSLAIDDVPIDGREEWCLVRWMSGVTAAILAARGEKNWIDPRDPVSGATFCGPLTEIQRGHFGFPEGSLGTIRRFDSLQECAIWRSSAHIYADIPAPLSAFVFWVRAFDHSSGEQRESPRTDYHSARRTYFQVKGQAGKADSRFNVTFQCWPLFDQLGEHRLTRAQADALAQTELSNADPDRAAEYFRACAGSSAFSSEEARAALALARTAFR
jgi:hypothetical protein